MVSLITLLGLCNNIYNISVSIDSTTVERAINPSSFRPLFGVRAKRLFSHRIDEKKTTLVVFRTKRQRK